MLIRPHIFWSNQRHSYSKIPRLVQYVEFSICIFQRVLGRTTVASTVSTVNLIAWTACVTATEIRGSVTTDKIL